MNEKIEEGSGIYTVNTTVIGIDTASNHEEAKENTNKHFLKRKWTSLVFLYVMVGIFVFISVFFIIKLCVEGYNEASSTARAAPVPKIMS
jgi:hypothetical protein